MFGSSSAIRIFLPRGQREGKAGAFAEPAFDPHAAAEMLDDLAADVEPQAAAVRLGGERVAPLAEFVEDHALVGGIDPRAVVAHFDAQGTRLLLERDADAAAPGLTELRRVRQQIEHHLDDAVDIGAYRRGLFGYFDVDPDVALLEHLAHAGHRVADQLAQVEHRLAPLRLARLDFGEVEHLVDQARQPL